MDGAVRAMTEHIVQFFRYEDAEERAPIAVEAPSG